MLVLCWFARVEHRVPDHMLKGPASWCTRPDSQLCQRPCSPAVPLPIPMHPSTTRAHSCYPGNTCAHPLDPSSIIVPLMLPEQHPCPSPLPQQKPCSYLFAPAVPSPPPLPQHYRAQRVCPSRCPPRYSSSARAHAQMVPTLHQGCAAV